MTLYKNPLRTLGGIDRTHFCNVQDVQIRNNMLSPWLWETHKQKLYNAATYLFHEIVVNIGIKYGFSYSNIRQVPREVLKTEAGGRGFQHLPRELANVNALKNHVEIAIIHKKLKTFATFRVISCTILFRLFTDVSRMQFPRTMLVLGPGSTHLVTAVNLWPRYNHIESCVAVH